MSKSKSGRPDKWSAWMNKGWRARLWGGNSKGNRLLGLSTGAAGAGWGRGDCAKATPMHNPSHTAPKAGYALMAFNGGRAFMLGALKP
jgi:hypothetical protein